MIAVASVSSKHSEVERLHRVDWAQVSRWLTTHKPGPKEGSGLVPALIEPGSRTCARVQAVSLLLLDIEGKAEEVKDAEGRVLGKHLTGPKAPPLAEVAADVELMGWAAVLATSHSHEAPALDGDTLGPRFRLTLQPSRPIRPDEVKPLARHVARLLGLSGCVDTSCWEPSRLYYLPRHPAERAHLAESRTVDGGPVDVDEMLAADRALQEQAKAEKAAKASQAAPPALRQRSDDGGVIQAFNDQADAGQILEAHGYEPAGRDRWRWPGSTTGMAGVVLLPESGRVYSHHERDPLFSEDRHAHDLFSVWTILAHGGDTRAAVREAAAMLGVAHSRNAPAVDFPGLPQEWPDLDPLPSLESLDSRPEPFPMEALGPIAGPAAAAIARKVQAPDAIAAGSVLASIAVATQALADVVLPHGAVTPLSLAVITAAASGDRKSATDAVAGESIEAYRRQQFRDYAADLAEFERAAKGPKAERPAPPIAKALTVSKGTVEGLTKLLRHQSHVGLFSPDGADVLGGHSMQAEKRASGIAWHLRAWSGESLDNLTAGEGLTAVAGRRVSMHLLVQPIVLQGLMADPLAQGQGLIARCLIASPATLAGTRLFKLPTKDDEATIATLHERIRGLLLTPPRVHPDGDGLELQPRRLMLDERATALWIAYHDELERRMAPGADLSGVRPWASKAPEQAARIAAGLAMLADSSASQVTADLMECGLRVASFYLGEHVRLMGASVEAENLKRLHSLADFMSNRGRAVEHREVLQRAPREVRNLKAEGISPLLDELTQRGYIRKVGSTWQVRQ